MNPQLISMIRQNRMEDARKLCARLCKAQPKDAQIQFMMSAICGQLGDYTTSEKYCRKAIKLNPAVPEAHFNLGVAQLQLGKPRDAVRSFRRVLELRPGFPEALSELGNAWQQCGKSSEAIDCYRRSLAQRPGHAQTLCNLGAALAETGDIDGARECCQIAMSVEHQDVEILERLASLCKQLGLLADSVKCYREVIQVKPGNARLLSNLGVALKEFGQLDEAIEVHEQAVSCDPQLAEAHFNLGSALSAANRQKEAEEAYRRALVLNSEFAEAWTNLGTLQMLQGRIGEALDSLGEALCHSPGYPLAASNRLFAMNYTPDLSPSYVYDAHCRWGAALLARTAKDRFQPVPRKDAGLLRVGFVSPDFRGHSVAAYFESLLDDSQAAVEIYCYSAVHRPDATTDRIRAKVSKWCDITGMTDRQAAEQIQSDQLDMLIDLAGHTGDNRLGIFALRPCALQATYLGYPNTTGLSTVDYRITDAVADPDGAEEVSTEKLLRLEPCFLCYTPPAEAPDIHPPGDDAGRPFTFASFNNLAKVTDDTLGVWAEILKQVPDSRLLIKSRPLGEPAVAARILDCLADCGIESERVELLSWIPSTTNHLAIYNQVDICLDTFPYHGTTTTCEALWMGRPVVTRQGFTHAARVGASIMQTLGLNELVVGDEQAYIQKAVELARDLSGFRQRYGDLRIRMLQSPLCDSPTFRHSFFGLLNKVVEEERGMSQ